MNVPLLPHLSVSGKDALLAPVTKEEVRLAVFSMKSYKSPGPDGFQPVFFKHLWAMIGDDLWNLVRNTLSQGYADDRLAKTLIVLIPKIDHPVHMKNFRPIILCNVVYKIITKVLVQRLRPFLDELVGPLQSSFIPGSGTTDNAILAQEVIHYMHTSKAKNGSIAFKIDLEKAYDRVNWDFLELTFRDFGFPLRTVALIMWCVRSTKFFYFIWNGSKLESFQPSKGLRQGDPISTYLFVLCVEKLAPSIQHKVDLGLWNPIHVSRGGPGLSHLFLADDVLLFCKATVNQVNLISKTQVEFCDVSGLKVNFEKSKAMCSSKIPRHRKERLAHCSSIRIVEDLGTYLGF